MFLVVFVTLVISIIGLYAQILSVQTNKIYHAQYGLMQTMITWHSAAVSLVTPFILNQSLGPLSGNGCQLDKSPNLLVNGTTNVPVCAETGHNVLVTNPPTGTPPVLPNGYQPTPYTFSTIVYQTPAPIEDYVITFVYATDDNSPTGNILLPGTSGTVVAYSLNSLMQQFAHGAPAYIGYGVVTSLGNLSVSSQSAGGGATVNFTIPNVIPVNSIAMISSAN